MHKKAFDVQFEDVAVEDKPLFKEGIEFAYDKMVYNAITKSSGGYFPFNRPVYNEND